LFTFGTVGLKYKVLDYFYFILAVSLKPMFGMDSFITGFADISKNLLTTTYTVCLAPSGAKRNFCVM